MRFQLLSPLALVALVVNSCAPSVAVDSAFRQDVSLAKSGSITVLRAGSDPINFQGTLEFALIKGGFNVVSEAVARNALSTEITTTTTGNTTTTQITSGPIKQVKSRLIVQYKYSWVGSYATQLFIDQLEAEIIDLKTGEFLGKIITKHQPGRRMSSAEIAQIIVNEVQSRIQ